MSVFALHDGCLRSENENDIFNGHHFFTFFHVVSVILVSVKYIAYLKKTKQIYYHAIVQFVKES